MATETMASLKADLASAVTAKQHLESEWDTLLAETIALHDQVRTAAGTHSLLTSYIRDTAVIMGAIGNAQENRVLQEMFRDLTARLKRQQEASERADVALSAALRSLEDWKGKVRC